MNLAAKDLFRFRGYTEDDIGSPEKIKRIETEIEQASKGQVWHSPLSDQNDPFDTHPRFVRSTDADLKRLRKRLNEELGSYFSFSGKDLRSDGAKLGVKPSVIRKNLQNTKLLAETIEQAYKEHRKQKICCFCETWKTPLLWSYYANAHRSFCYWFQVDDENRLLARTKIGKIKYVETRPRLTTLDLANNMLAAAHPELFPLSPDDDERIQDATVMTKSSHWKHEREWRSVKLPSEENGFHSITPYHLAGIIFGARASDTFIEGICELAHGVPKMYCKLSEENYDLELMY